MEAATARAGTVRRREDEYVVVAILPILDRITQLIHLVNTVYTLSIEIVLVLGHGCWFAAGGVPCALAYKAVNTLDSMIGHPEPPYHYFGRVAARLDDAVNLIPARLTALGIVGRRDDPWFESEKSIILTEIATLLIWITLQRFKGEHVR